MIYIKNNLVYRKTNIWSNQIHLFLEFLNEEKFSQVPRFFGFDDKGNEILSYVEGNTYDFDYPICNEAILVSSARLLRIYHDISQRFIDSKIIKDPDWIVSINYPIEVICHNDFAPYNICYKNNRAVGIIDFDMAMAGPRIWDIVYAVYRFAPFMTSHNKEYFGNIDEQIKRATLFCRTYGLNQDSMIGFVDLMIKRLEMLINFMIGSADRHDKKYTNCIDENHHIKYLNDINYIKLYKSLIEKSLNN